MSRMDPIDPVVLVPRIALERVLEHVRNAHALSMDAWSDGNDLPGALEPGDASYLEELERALARPVDVGGAARNGGGLTSAQPTRDPGHPAPPPPPAAGAATITVHLNANVDDAAALEAGRLAHAMRHRGRA